MSISLVLAESDEQWGRVYILGLGAVTLLCQQQTATDAEEDPFDFSFVDPNGQVPCCDIVVMLRRGFQRRNPVHLHGARITYVSGGKSDDSPYTFGELVTALHGCPDSREVLGILVVNALSLAVELVPRKKSADYFVPLLSVAGATFWQRGSSESVRVSPLGYEVGNDVAVYSLKTRGGTVVVLALCQASAGFGRPVEPPWVMMLFTEPVVYPCSVLSSLTVALVSKVWWWSAFIVAAETIRTVRDMAPFLNALGGSHLQLLRKTFHEYRGEHTFPAAVTKLWPSPSPTGPFAPPPTVHKGVTVSSLSLSSASVH